MGLNSEPYQFLSFYKIINILHARGTEQIKWIDEAIYKIYDKVDKLLANLENGNQTIGEYLHASGRCAIAHAFSRPLVNPESLDDLEKLRISLPIIKSLAEYAIEHEFGVNPRKF